MEGKGGGKGGGECGRGGKAKGEGRRERGSKAYLSKENKTRITLLKM